MQQKKELASQWHERGDLCKAKSLYQDILRKDPEDPITTHMLGVIAYQTGKPNKAIELIKQALLLDPDSADAHYNLGYIFKALGKPEKALGCFRNTVQLNSEYYQAHNEMGSVLVKLGKAKEAISSYRRAIAIMPQFGQAHSNLLTTMETLGGLGKNNSSVCTEKNMRIKRCRYGLMLYNLNDQYIGRSLDIYGEYCENEVALFKQFIKPGMLVCDLGANIGCHTVFLGKTVGLEGKVYAFEPQRILFQNLCANISLNLLANIHAYNSAVGNHSGSIVAPIINYSEENNFGGYPLTKIGPGEDASLIMLDSLSLPECHFIKIDIEGMEKAALEGARETIRKFKPILYVENDRQKNTAELITFLRSMDYRLYQHLPLLFNPTNFFKYEANIFGNTPSINVLCIPRHSSYEVQNMDEITSFDRYPTD